MVDKHLFEAARRAGEEGEHKSRMGLYLKMLRSAHHKTLREVTDEAQQYGEVVSASLLADAENGNVIPSAPKLITLAKIYHVHPQRFLDLIDLDRQPKTVPGEKSPGVLEKRADGAFQAGDYAQAYAYLEEALSFPAEPAHAALLRNRKAECLWKMGKLQWARDEFERVLGLFELDDSSRVQAYSNLSAVFRQMGNFEMSRAMALQALALTEVHDDSEHQGAILNTLGDLDYDLYEHRERSDSFLLGRAIEHYSLSLDFFKKTKDKQAQRVVVLMNLGHSYILNAQGRKGYRNLHDALKLSEKLNHHRYTALALSGLGKGHYEQEGYEAAKDYFHKSELMAVRHGYPDIRFVNHYYLWRMARAERNEVVERRAHRALKTLLKQCDSDSVEVARFLEFLQEEKGGKE
ncbi:MAG: tetratricopeptide repeat protein [Acidobacteriota bacterium]|nr:MAG: tetratricopeptide repeat protein [Acidobacteriota bacterium]